MVLQLPHKTRFPLKVALDGFYEFLLSPISCDAPAGLLAARRHMIYFTCLL